METAAGFLARPVAHSLCVTPHSQGTLDGVLAFFTQLNCNGEFDMTGIRKGTEVEWKWGKGTAEGKVEKRFTTKHTETVKGHKITRDASKDDPAYLIKQDNGQKVLKSDSEVEKVS